ncbi:MAG: Ulp1 family isopeptidase, partial [Promethearchaeia archaeon]
MDECQMDEGQMDDGSGLHDIDDDDSGLHNNDVPAVSQSQVAQVGTGGTSETKARLHAHAVAPVPDAKAVKTRADGTASSSSGIPPSCIGMRTTRASRASMASSGTLSPPPPESNKNQGSPGDVLFVFPFHQQGADTVTVTRADLDTLQDEELLNDTIMDFYIKHIESNLDQETKQQCHFFSTFFWKRLNQEKDARARHAGVAKWTRKVDIFSKRFLFVPICDSLHWTLAILCAPEGIGQLDEGGSGGGAHQSGEFARCELPDDKGGKLLHITLYLDSLGGYKKDAIEKLADYLRMEWLAKKAPGQAEANRND